MDAQFPGVAESLDDFGLAAQVVVSTVLDVAVVLAHLPVAAVLDAVGRVDVDALHLAGHALALQQAGHHQQAVALDQAVLPLVLAVVVGARLLLLIHRQRVAVQFVHEQVVLRFVAVLQAVQPCDQRLGSDVLMAVQAADVDVEPGLRVVITVLAQPIQLRILSTMGNGVERQGLGGRTTGDGFVLLAGFLTAGNDVALVAGMFDRVDRLVAAFGAVTCGGLGGRCSAGGHGQAVQSSTVRPCTRWNSPRLLVTTVRPVRSPWAAIQVSFGPIFRPEASRA